MGYHSRMRRRTCPAADELVHKVLCAMDAENEPDQIGARRQQDVTHSAGRTRVTVTPLSPKLHSNHDDNKVKQTAIRLRRIVQGRPASTYQGGRSAILAEISGRMHTAASQP